LDRDVAQVAGLVPPLPRDERIGPPALVEAVRGLLRDAMHSGRQGRLSPALILVGPDGCGKRSLVAAVGADLGCGLLLVPATVFPDDRESMGLLARAIAREAVLFRAIP